MAVVPQQHQQRDMRLWLRRCELAVQKGVAEAAMRHKQAGVPMVIAEHGAVKLVQPEDIVVNYDILNAPYPEI